MDTIFLIIPITESMEGSEGVPNIMPKPHECWVAYSEDDANTKLLEKKLNNPNDNFALFQSIGFADESAVVKGVYKIVEPTPLYHSCRG